MSVGNKFNHLKLSEGKTREAVSTRTFISIQNDFSRYSLICSISVEEYKSTSLFELI
jgi:hypothetical protein